MFVDFGRPGKNWLHLADKMYKKKEQASEN